MATLDRKGLARQAASCAARARARHGLPFIAPVDIVSLAEDCGCEVRFMSLPSLEGVYSPTPRPTIVIGSERPAGRRTYNCAHELGHHLFNHGMRVDGLDAQRYSWTKAAEEYLADVFAGMLLMTREAIRRSIKNRGWSVQTLTAHQVFRLAAYFGVGYMTLLSHMKWSLSMISRSAYEELRKTTPKQLKADFAAPAQTEAVIVDCHWKHRAVDLAVEDTLILPVGARVEGLERLAPQGLIQGQPTFKATAKGYSRACREADDWAVNIRISARGYQGLARYRFYEDV